MLTPREVHKTGKSAPKKDSKQYEIEQKRLREIAKKLDRGEPIFVPRDGKLSTKDRKASSNEFELAREQFEIVKAAREKAALERAAAIAGK